MSYQEFLQREVPGWRDEDDVRVSALFKAFSGQRPDWQHRLNFWKALIVNLSRHLSRVVIHAHEVQHAWFHYKGMLPLCIDDVLREMLQSGELQALDDRPPGIQPSRLGWAVSSLGHVLSRVLGFHTETSKDVVRGKLVVSVLLKERVSHICKALADTSWKSECVVTMSTLVDLCGTVDDAKAVTNYLLQNRLAAHLSIVSEEIIEGLKVSLALRNAVSPPSQIDYHMLQLFWTSEKMKQRLDLLNERVTQLRSAAITCLKLKDKQGALRKLKSMKILSQSRDKCADMMAKIHEILDAISDAETTKKVAEAVQVGNLAIRQHHVTLEDVHEQLREVDESMTLAREAGEALGVSRRDEEEDELEDEFARLEKEVIKEETEVKPTSTTETSTPVPSASEEDEELVTSMSKLEVSM